MYVRVSMCIISILVQLHNHDHWTTKLANHIPDDPSNKRRQVKWHKLRTCVWPDSKSSVLLCTPVQSVPTYNIVVHAPVIIHVRTQTRTCKSPFFCFASDALQFCKASETFTHLRVRTCWLLNKTMNRRRDGSETWNFAALYGKLSMQEISKASE